MSYVIMTVPVHLHEGCPLNYLGKRVTFLRYAEVPVGPLDPLGQRPGRYVDHHNVIVKYSDGEFKVPAKDLEFVDTYPKPPAAHIQNGFSQGERLGDLRYPIQLWPGDRIKSPGRDQDWFTVEKIVFDPDGKPTYELWNETRSVKYILHCLLRDEMLVRGNVYHLYHDHDPKQMKFASDQEELAFWTQEGISVCGLGRGTGGQPLWPCADFFHKGFADLIVQTTPNGVWYRAYKLHDIFAGHRTYVRAFTERLYGARMDAEIARVAEVARERAETK